MRSISVGALVSTLVLGACSHGPGKRDAKEERIDAAIKRDAEYAQKYGSPEQASAMADGVITRSEYRRAFARYERCLNRRGVRLDHPVESPVDGRMVSTPHPETDASRVAKIACFKHVGYIEADLALRPPRLAPAFRDALVACVRRHHVPVPAHPVTLHDFWRPASGPRIGTVSFCVDELMPRFYPQVPAYEVNIPAIR